MQFNWDLVVNSFPLLLVGAGVTIKITAMSVALGVIIGLFVGIARICHFKPLRFVAAVYVDFFRGTPLLVQIFLVYFALPVKRVIPPLGNEFIALLKDSSLVSVIGFEELTRRGQLIIAKTYGSLEIWISVAIVYLVMTLTISRFVAYLERRFATDDQH